MIRKCSSLLKGTITEGQRPKRWLISSWALSWECACFHWRVAIDILISEASRQLYPPFRGAARADNRCLNGWCISHKHCGLVLRGKVSEIMMTYATHRKTVMVQRNICTPPKTLPEIHLTRYFWHKHQVKLVSSSKLELKIKEFKWKPLIPFLSKKKGNK